MGARQRLNSVYLTGVFFVAALIGGACHSWFVFLLIAAVLTTALIHGGDIRPQRITRPHHRRRRRR